jgi:hypothetical protein
MDLENRFKLSGKTGKVMEFELFEGVATLVIFSPSSFY